LKTILLKHDDIDKSKWDECVNHSPNGLIYAESVYLDAMAPGWQGIIADDYSAVMPLCHRSKLGIPYLYQPAFCQQGGIFFKTGTIQDYEADFFQILKSHYRFAEINLNFSHENFADINPLKKGNNYLRLLSVKGYPDYINVRLRRLRKFEMKYRITGDFKNIITAYRLLYANRISSITRQDFDGFTRLCQKLHNEGRLIMREVWDVNEKKLLASCILLSGQGRIYNLINNLFPEGRPKLANYFLFQQIFEEFAESGKIFDFEGSDLKGVGYFYEKFSTGNQPFYKFRYNNLPGYIKWLKG